MARSLTRAALFLILAALCYAMKSTGLDKRAGSAPFEHVIHLPVLQPLNNCLHFHAGMQLFE